MQASNSLQIDAMATLHIVVCNTNTMNTMRFMSPLVLVVLLATQLATSNAQAGYDNPPTLGAPPPPFAVKGKQFPPESTTCLDPKTPCFGMTLSCPQQCPQMKPANPKEKACFVDCTKPTCEPGTCKQRKPNCEGSGAACYDPRFVGGDGIMFYFHGKAGGHFALVSDSALQINARFIGIRPAGRTRDFTWIQALGVRFGTHSFTLSAERTSFWDPTADRLSLYYDNQPVLLDEGHLATWSAGGLRVERISGVNSVAVTLPEVFEMMASVVPVTAEDARVHRYRIPADDSFAHLEVQFKFLSLSDEVEGVLGQTYRPDFRNPVRRGVPMPIMSGEDRYATDSLLSTECRYCIFSPDQAARADTPRGGADVLDCSGKLSDDGYGVVCRR